MRKFVIAAFAAFGLIALTLGAFAQPIYQGGSETKGLIPWYGQSLGPYGVDHGQRSGGDFDHRRFGGGGQMMGGGQMNRQGGTWYRRSIIMFRNVYPVPQAAQCCTAAPPAAQCCAAPQVAPRPVYHAPRPARIARTCGNGCRPTRPACSTCRPTNNAVVNQSPKIVVTGSNNTITLTQTGNATANSGTAVTSATTNVEFPRSVARVISSEPGKFCFQDDKGVQSTSANPHPVGSKFRVDEKGAMYWL
jgi:hypothetical protein